MPIITTNSELTDLWPKTPRSIARSSASAQLHHGLSSAAFTINIAESNIRYRQLTEDECIEIDARATTDIALLATKQLNQQDDNARRKKKIREDLAYLEENRVTLLRSGAFTPESLVVEERKLNLHLEALKREEDASDLAIQETVDEVVKLSELLKSLAATYSAADPVEKDQIIRLVFSELILSKNTFEYKCRNGFQALESRFLPSHDPTGWLVELYRHRAVIRQSIHELETFSAHLALDDEEPRRAA
jgi:hypothetical protein